VRFPGKSQLQLYQEMASESELRDVVNSLTDSAAEKGSPLELEEPLDLGMQFLDSTCVELNIHYPTDWLLLRDAVRTLMKATMLNRKRGLKVRMDRVFSAKSEAEPIDGADCGVDLQLVELVHADRQRR
jgi:hypothetical protein